MVSARAYAELQSFREPHLQQQIAEGMASIEAGRVSACKDVIQRMRKRVLDAKL